MGHHRYNVVTDAVANRQSFFPFYKPQVYVTSEINKLPSLGAYIDWIKSSNFPGNIKSSKLK